SPQSSAEREIVDSVQVFTALRNSIERSQAELIELIEEKQRAAERRAEGIIKELEQEITELKRRNTELEQLSHTEDHIHFLKVSTHYREQIQYLQRAESPTGCSVTPVLVFVLEAVGGVELDCVITSWMSCQCLLQTHSSTGQTTHSCVLLSCLRDQHSTTAHNTAHLETRLPQECALSSLTSFSLFAEFERLRKHAADVTLDPNTAHPNLILSEDGKQVRHGSTPQDLPDNPERFDTVVSVLGKDGITSGRHYWEVAVGEKTACDLGVTGESSSRKGQNRYTSQDGYWVLYLRNGNKYKANSVLLPLSQKPQKVGVYVDYEGGQVSFYNVDNRSHIYTFTASFTEKLFPYFCPGLHRGGANSAPLIICPVSHTG
ncbi:A33 protein, partial [Atractosteus spatula]|nr:A33 protein [Atractosteus spatula]